MSEEKKVLDWRTTSVGRENWETCHRMLVHDLIDLAPNCPVIQSVLQFYGISFHESGGYTMALPRLGVLTQSGFIRPKVKKAKKK